MRLARTRISNRLCLLVAVVAASWLRPCAGRAEEKQKPNPNRYEPIVFPILGGSSDIGFLFGASGAVARLEEGYYPYRWKGTFSASTSVKEGADEVEFPVNHFAAEFDVPGLAGGRLRVFPKLEFTRVSNAGYYGYGNASPLTEAPEGSSREVAFRHNSYRLMDASAQLRLHVALVDRLYLIAGAGFDYVMPTVYDGSVLERDIATSCTACGAPILRGSEDHAIASVRLGFGYDNRDNETSPTRGAFCELSVRGSPGRPGADNFPLFGAGLLHLRFFFPLVGEYLVLAVQARTDLFFGYAPFEELDLGDIRGVPKRRYYGKVKLLGSAEYRSVFYRFGFLKQRFGLGAAAFFDGGRVWADWREDPERDGTGQGLKYGVGGGLRFLWGETRILRFDVAYSPDKAALTPKLPVGFYARMSQFF